MKANFFCRLAGAVLVMAAVILLGFDAGWWYFGVNTGTLWTLILSVPFLVWMLIFGVNLINTLGFFGGLGVLIYYNGYVPEDKMNVFIIIMSLFAAGTFAAGRSYKHIKPTVLEPDIKSRINPDINVFAGMKHIQNKFDGITGGRFKVFSGSLLYDFRKAGFDKDIKMSVKIRFGDIYLVFPDNILVQSDVKGNFANGLAATKNHAAIVSIDGTVKYGKLHILRAPEEKK